MHMPPGCSRGSVRYSRVPAGRELIVFLLSSCYSYTSLFLKKLVQGLQQFVQAPVVQKVDSAIHRIKCMSIHWIAQLAPPNIYLLDSDLSGG